MSDDGHTHDGNGLNGSGGPSGKIITPENSDWDSYQPFGRDFNRDEAVAFLNRSRGKGRPPVIELEDATEKEFDIQDSDEWSEEDDITPEIMSGVLAEGSLCMIYGPPNSGKSFLAVHMALCLAAGEPFLGRDVHNPGIKTLYMATESQNNIRTRIRKAKQNNPTWKCNHRLHFWGGDIDLSTAKSPDTERLITLIKERHIRALVLDTWNHTYPGVADENSMANMMGPIAALKRIVEETGATLIIVHHSAKSGVESGPRGSSAIHGAFDTILLVHDPRGTKKIGQGQSRSGVTGGSSTAISGGSDDVRVVEAFKQRLLNNDFYAEFRIRLVTIGTTCFGKPATTRVVEMVDGDSHDRLDRYGKYRDFIKAVVQPAYAADWRTKSNKKDIPLNLQSAIDLSVGFFGIMHPDEARRREAARKKLTRYLGYIKEIGYFDKSRVGHYVMSDEIEIARIDDAIGAGSIVHRG